MQLDKTSLKEEAYIGEDLASARGISPLETKCFVIKQVVSDKDMSLHEAMAAYGVTAEQYSEYLSKLVMAEIAPLQMKENEPATLDMEVIALSLDVIAKLYKKLLSSVDSDSKKWEAHLRSLAKKIATGKLKV